MFSQGRLLKILMLFIVLLPACSYRQPYMNTAIEEMQNTLDDAAASALEQQVAEELAPKSVMDSLRPGFGKNGRSHSLRFHEPRFDVAVNDAPARNFFMGLVKDTPYNMILHPKLSGVITLNLKNVTIDETLETVRKIYGYDYIKTDLGYEIFPLELTTRVFKVDYLFIERLGKSEIEVISGGLEEGGDSGEGDSSDSSDSSDSGEGESGEGTKNTIMTNSESRVWAELERVLLNVLGGGVGRKVSVSPNTGMIIVTALPSELQKIQEYIDSVQSTLHRQVILEAKILEVELNDRFQSGINWAKIQSDFSYGSIGGGSTFTGNGLTSTVSETGIAGNVGNLNPDAFTAVSQAAVAAFGGTFSIAAKGDKFHTFMEFLGTQGNVQVLSSPRISTANNQKAIIKVGTEEFFVTDVSGTTTASTAATSTISNISLDPFFSGVALDVTPQISDDGAVILHVHPIISNVNETTKNVVINGATQTLPLAVNTVREADSVIRANSGEVVVIGGLMQNETIEHTAGIPLLEDFPYIGSIFRHTKQTSKKSELVILLRPTVVDDKTWGKKLIDASDRYHYLDRGFHQGSKIDQFGNQGERPDNWFRFPGNTKKPTRKGG